MLILVDPTTLRPPPTLEPATPTPQPTAIPIATSEPTFQLNVDTSEIRGLETNTPTPEACNPRDDWKLVYEVQPFDTVESISNRYGTNSWVLAEANCLDDINVISIGQRLRVPGDAHPDAVVYDCTWEALTPMNHAYGVDGLSMVSFNWRGPRAPRNLLRIYDSAGNVILERTVDRAQNIQVNFGVDMPTADGTYSWAIFPLDLNFQQIPCPESPRWYFHKTQR